MNHERLLVHKFTEANGLFSVSAGYGKERFIKIFGKSKQTEQSATALSSREKKFVNQLTLWANTESQELRGMSRNSVAEMVKNNSLHPALARIKARHEKATLLCDAIHSKKFEMAENLLREDASLAHCSCSRTGEIPLHAAMATGSLALVKLMKQMSNEAEEKQEVAAKLASDDADDSEIIVFQPRGSELSESRVRPAASPAESHLSQPGGPVHSDLEKFRLCSDLPLSVRTVN
eukprot:329518-Hanusia_phi.AAC.1